MLQLLSSAGGAVCVRHVTRGRFLVEQGGNATEASSPLDAGRALAAALAIVAKATNAVRIDAEGEGATARITREEGVTGFRLALELPAGSHAIGVGAFEQAVVQLLDAAPLWPEDVPRDRRPPTFGSEYEFAAFQTSTDPSALAAALARDIGAHLDASGIPALAWNEVIEALRRRGHDLWSWDDFGDGSIWGHDYVTRRPGGGLRLDASYPHYSPASVSAAFEFERSMATAELREAGTGRVWMLQTGDSWRIDRRAHSHVCLPYPLISKHHARIELRGSGFWLIDGRSTNTATCNGVSIGVGGAVRLDSGDVIGLGETRLGFRVMQNAGR